MAKRFIDTDIFKKAWFAELHADQQQLWFYICTQCDVAGFWEKNYRLASFELKRQVSDVSFECFKDRVIHFEDDKLWIKGFVEFQYGALSESCKPHKTVITLLRKRGIDPQNLTLCKGYENPTRQDKTRIGQDKTSVVSNDDGNAAPKEEPPNLPGFTQVDPAHLERVVQQLNRTLAHFKAGRDALDSEKQELWKMLASKISVEELAHAISGMRFEAKTLSYDPAKHIDIFKLWDRQRRVKMLTLSTQEQQRRASKGGAA